MWLESVGYDFGEIRYGFNGAVYSFLEVEHSDEVQQIEIDRLLHAIRNRIRDTLGLSHLSDEYFREWTANMSLPDAVDRMAILDPLAEQIISASSYREREDLYGKTFDVLHDISNNCVETWNKALDLHERDEIVDFSKLSSDLNFRIFFEDKKHLMFSLYIELIYAALPMSFRDALTHGKDRKRLPFMKEFGDYSYQISRGI